MSCIYLNVFSSLNSIFDYNEFNYKFLFFSNLIPFISIISVFFFVIMLRVLIIPSGIFTSFLQRFIFYTFIFYFFIDNSFQVFRIFSEENNMLLEISQEDSLYFRFFFLYSLFVVAIFFFGIAERFFLSKRSSREFAVIVFFIYIGSLFVLKLHTTRDILLALEIITLASYVLVNFENKNRFSTYAGIQYFLLGSMPSAMLILSFAFIYLQMGSLVIQDLDFLYNSFNNNFIESRVDINYYFNNIIENTFNFSKEIDFNFNQILSFDYFTYEFANIFNSINVLTSFSVRALFFFMFNVLFKITAAPFHQWAPMVYGNAPIASVTFLSIYSKVMIFFFMFKIFNSIFYAFSYIILVFFVFAGVLSIFIGMLGAFTEKMIKRFFVYSSMGHVGFMLIGFSLFTMEASSATFHYLFVYMITSFLMWFLVISIGRQKQFINQISSIKNTDPFLVFPFAFLIFSMSGIPPLGGFFIKLDILTALFETSHFFVNYILFIFTVVSFFYYLRLMKILFFDTTYRNKKQVAFNTYNDFYINKVTRYNNRIWIIVAINLFLIFYLFIVQKPLLIVQSEILSSVY